MSIQIPSYTLLSLLGIGSMAEVWLAEHNFMRRKVALKILKPGALADQDSRALFVREGEVLASFNHPNIVAIYECGISGDHAYLAMELLEGGTLLERMQRNPIPVRTSLSWVGGIARGLEMAHQRKVVHRDLKPNNIMLRDEATPVLTDFGAARVLDRSTIFGREGGVVGTPLYMSPEQIMAKPLDGRSDFYSLGVILFELLSGRHPYPGNRFDEILSMHLHAPLPQLPEGFSILQKLMDKLLAKNPDDRFASSRELIKAIAEIPIDELTLLPVGQLGYSTLRMQAPSLSSTVELRAVETSAAENAAVVKENASTGTFPRKHVVSISEVGELESANDAQISRLPHQIGRFILHERIASGNCGKLYKGWDPVRGRLVAIKVIEFTENLSRERLLRGAKIWIDLVHENISRIYEIHPEYYGRNGIIVSEFVESPNLEELILQRVFEVTDAAWITMQLCSALALIHRKGIVHREVKPRNLLVNREDLSLILLDSGIARHANPAVDSFTQTGMFVGDLVYSAPEQFTSKIDHRADIYSATAVLYEMVSGKKVPFPRGGDAELLIDETSSLPNQLRYILQKGLQRKPELRFSSVDELIDELKFFAPGRKLQPVRQSVVALHGIRTQAAWQRAFAEVATTVGLGANIDRWNFGYFSSVRFLMPWARIAKVRWFRETYQMEFQESGVEMSSKLPSIVAHSFGTYILGNALLRYPYLRFDKVLLCGSILPTDFPWDQIITRGQVQVVRNEFGSEDIWTKWVGHFVPGTGPSGLVGFVVTHPSLKQERFDFAHSEYFDRSHMKSRWIPFLSVQTSQRVGVDTAIGIRVGKGRWPVGLCVLYAILLFALYWIWILVRPE